MAFNEEDTAFIKLCDKKVFWGEKAYQRVYEWKTGLCHLWSCWRGLIKLVLWIANWRLQTNSHVSFVPRKCQEHAIPFIWFSDDKFLLLLCQWTFRMTVKLLCC